MRMALMLGSGLFWTVTYVLIILRGFKDKTYGMPIAALGANISWEFIFAFIRPSAGPQMTVNIIWFVCDLAILFTLLRFGQHEFKGMPKPVFYATAAGTIAVSYLAVNLVSTEFDDGRATYAAFGQNLMMSALFISMLLVRGSLRGQSVWIAAAKLIGTALASAAIWGFDDGRDTSLLIFLYVTTFVLDAVYLAAVVAVKRRRSLPAPMEMTGISSQESMAS